MDYIKGIALAIVFIVYTVTPTLLFIILSVQFKKYVPTRSFVLLVISTLLIAFLSALKVGSLVFPMMNRNNMELIAKYLQISSIAGTVSSFLLLIIIAILLFQLKGLIASNQKSGD